MQNAEYLYRIAKKCRTWRYFHILHSAFCILHLFHDLHRSEPGIVRSDELIFNSAPKALDGELMRIGVQVAVEAPADAVFFQQLDDLPVYGNCCVSNPHLQHSFYVLPCLRAEKTSDGITTDILSWIDEGSTLFEMNVGDNLIAANDDEGGASLEARLMSASVERELMMPP